MPSFKQALQYLGLTLTSFASGQLTDKWRLDRHDDWWYFYPEGIAYDATNKRIILSYINSGVLAVFDAADDMKHIFTYAYGGGHFNAFGIALHPNDNNQLWVAGGNIRTFDGGIVTAYNITPTGDPMATVASIRDALELPFPCANADGYTGCGSANDIVFDKDGMAYITDTGMGKVYMSDGKELVEIVSDDILKHAGDFGVNGIVYHESSNSLLVGNYGSKILLKVDLAMKTVSKIELSESLMGKPDGLLLLADGRLAVVAGMEIILYTSDDTWTSATVESKVNIDPKEADEIPTTIAQGASELEVFVTHVRFVDILSDPPAPNGNGSMLTRVMLPELVAPVSNPEPTKAPTSTPEATKEPSSSSPTKAPVSNPESTKAPVSNPESTKAPVSTPEATKEPSSSSQITVSGFSILVTMCLVMHSAIF